MKLFFLFEVGDSIVYPMQGTGIIKSIEEKEFLGKKRSYYIIKMLTGNMEIMIPVDKISDSNVRLISDVSTLEKVLRKFHERQSNSLESLNSKQRQQMNMKKIKSGSLQETAEVVIDLILLNKKKPLNSSEKQMLDKAQRFLIDEISLIKEITTDEAEDLLQSKVD